MFLSQRPINKKIIITGGAGFIGAALSNSLVVDNSITLIDDGTAADWSRCTGEFERLQIDLGEVEIGQLVKIFDQADIVFHLAAVKLHNAMNSFEEIEKKNIVAAKNVFEAAGLAGVQNVIFTSSLYAYGSMGPKVMVESDLPQPSTYYGISKLAGEHLVRLFAKQYGFNFAIARLFFIYGPRQYANGGYKSVIVNTIEKIINNEPAIVYGDGKQELDYVYIEDCVNVLNALSVNNINDVVNVCTGKAISVNKVISEIGSCAGSSEVEKREADWTEGSRRVGKNEKLLSLIGKYEFISFSEGIRNTWFSMNRDKND